MTNEIRTDYGAYIYARPGAIARSHRPEPATWVYTFRTEQAVPAIILGASRSGLTLCSSATMCVVVTADAWRGRCLVNAMSFSSPSPTLGPLCRSWCCMAGVHRAPPAALHGGWRLGQQHG